MFGTIASQVKMKKQTSTNYRGTGWFSWRGQCVSRLLILRSIRSVRMFSNGPASPAVRNTDTVSHSARRSAVSEGRTRISLHAYRLYLKEPSSWINYHLSLNPESRTCYIQSVIILSLSFSCSYTSSIPRQLATSTRETPHTSVLVIRHITN